MAKVKAKGIMDMLKLFEPYLTEEDILETIEECKAMKERLKLQLTHRDILNGFKATYPYLTVIDYRPICHELFTDDKLGITIWLENGDVIEYYPKVDEEGEQE